MHDAYPVCCKIVGTEWGGSIPEAKRRDRRRIRARGKVGWIAKECVAGVKLIRLVWRAELCEVQLEANFLNHSSFGTVFDHTIPDSIRLVVFHFREHGSGKRNAEAFEHRLIIANVLLNSTGVLVFQVGVEKSIFSFNRAENEIERPIVANGDLKLRAALEVVEMQCLDIILRS